MKQHLCCTFHCGSKRKHKLCKLYKLAAYIQPALACRHIVLTYCLPGISASTPVSSATLRNICKANNSVSVCVRRVSGFRTRANSAADLTEMSNRFLFRLSSETSTFTEQSVHPAWLYVPLQAICWINVRMLVKKKKLSADHLFDSAAPVSAFALGKKLQDSERCE